MAIPSKKYKLLSEYNKPLLRRVGNSKRNLNENDGAELRPDPPSFYDNDENFWFEYEWNDRKREVWEKLGIEAFFIGWLSAIDTLSNREIYCHWEDDPSVDDQSEDAPPAGSSKVT